MLHYKTEGEILLNQNSNFVEYILKQRGVKDPKRYLNVGDEEVLDPLLLDNMDRAAQCLIEHIKAGTKIYIQIDSDCDGYTSASILINYLYRISPEFTLNNVTYGFHPNKSHGLNLNNIEEDVGLVIIPDAGSNEIEIHRQLKAKGIDVIILDHHKADVITDSAILVNNQTCNYPTKSLCGAAIVYKFCTYLDKINDTEIADDYLDLVALGLIADDMDLRDYETHRLIEVGLNNIKSPLIKGLVNKNSYSLKGHVTPIGAAFTLAPAINAITRVGSMEEKKLVFDALLDFKTQKQIKSTKRGAAWDMMETICEQAQRTVVNVKNRQNKIRDQFFNEAVQVIEDEDLLKNKVLVVMLKKDFEGLNELTGLIAIKIVSKYGKPVLLLHKVEEDGKIFWRGSGRNNPRNGLLDFRTFLKNSKKFDYVEGHDNAFGVSLEENNVDDFLRYANSKLENYEFTTEYLVDYESNLNNLNYSFISDIIAAEDLWGHSIEEPIVLVKNIGLSDKFVYLKPNSKETSYTLIIKPNEKIEFVKFGLTPEEASQFKNHNINNLFINLLGTCKLNTFNGKPQIFISDYELEYRKYVF